MVIKTNGSQKEQQVLDFGTQKKSTLLHYDLEYDTTNPEDTIRKFVENMKGMMARYDGNNLRLIEIEQEINDIEHYMEIGKYKNIKEGYRLYRKLAELRRERRACKNENDLLWPVYEHFHGTEFLNKLTYVQGECSKVRNTVDARVYSVRTDVLDEWIDPVNDGAGIGVNMLTGETEVMTIPVPGLTPAGSASQTEKKYSLAWSEKRE